VAEKAIKLTAREKRFIKFASVEFDGQIYMTPQDFLESVVEQEPRREWISKFLVLPINFSMKSILARLKRRTLTQQEIQQLKEITPPLKGGNSQLFRSLRDRGIVSYTEYLFLLSVLTSKSPNSKNLSIFLIFIRFRAHLWISDCLQHVRHGWKSKSR
jgi:hypothetical protein